MEAITYAYAASSNAIRNRLEAPRASERGQGTLEYLGLLILVAGIVTILVSQTDVAGVIKRAVMDAIKSVTDLSPGSGSGSSGDS